MFPIEDLVNEPELRQREADTGSSFLFDFTVGEFVLRDGNLVEVEGLEALKVWIEKIIRTEKFKFKIYEGDTYGVRLMDLLTGGFPAAFVEAEIQREIVEALETNPEIRNVEDLRFTRGVRTLLVSFTVKSVYGEDTMGVVL